MPPHVFPAHPLVTTTCKDKSGRTHRNAETNVVFGIHLPIPAYLIQKIKEPTGKLRAALTLMADVFC